MCWPWTIFPMVFTCYQMHAYSITIQAFTHRHLRPAVTSRARVSSLESHCNKQGMLKQMAVMMCDMVDWVWLTDHQIINSSKRNFKRKSKWNRWLNWDLICVSQYTGRHLLLTEKSQRKKKKFPLNSIIDNTAAPRGGKRKKKWKVEYLVKGTMCYYHAVRRNEMEGYLLSNPRKLRWYEMELTSRGTL